MLNPEFTLTSQIILVSPTKLCRLSYSSRDGREMLPTLITCCVFFFTCGGADFNTSEYESSSRWSKKDSLGIL
ncbi:hypothetical protein BD408DRAFT_274742 [Parasitella parasitica]|nr:hypothetical protein BD408DRAFT_274742 [Parasitella parasitica]